MARPPAGGLWLLLFFTAEDPPPHGSSMAGQFSGAGERLPIRHGVGGFTTSFTPRSFCVAHFILLLRIFRRVQVHCACARFAAGRAFFFSSSVSMVSGFTNAITAKAELPLPRLCLGGVPHGVHKDEERRLERGSLK
jgi:hypothetical protein